MGHWKSKRLSVDKKNISKWLMVNRKAKIVVPHMAIRNMEVLRPLGITPDGLGLDFFLPKTVQNPITDPASSYVTWAIGGQHETKKLPLEKLEEIARRAPIKTYILGGKEDEDSGNLLASKYQNVINLCGKTSLHESAKAIQESLLLLTHDTGMMHIGAALNKPIFSVWGNTVPEFGMSPFLPTEDNKVFEVNDLDCRPCSKIGHKACPKGHFSCMTMQNTKDIIQSIDELAKSKMV
jgi:ADP-heptose:LPS heptosyltransferase